MSAKVFIDTNVLVYAYDRSEPQKQKRALEVIDQLTQAKIGVISTQILGEFFVSVVRKTTIPMNVNDAVRQAELHSRALQVLEVTSAIVLNAAQGVRDYKFSYYDAQIWAAAKANSIPTVFSEDFNSGSTIEGVTFINPFDPGFRLEDYL